jgi:predicted DNA-binding transcriptional regulator YafY
VRADRLLAIVLLLQVHARMTARQLAERLEVCERTIYRDLDSLSAAGVPVITDRGPGGGVGLKAGYRADLTAFTPSEARTLFPSGMLEPLSDLGFGGDVASARRKLMAALPVGTRAEAERAAQRLHVDPGPWWRVAEEPGWLPVLVQAVWGARRLHIHYRRADVEEGTWRLVEPLGLVAKAGTWYLIAHRDGMRRIYRVSRIGEARVDEAVFERPPGFDLAAFWKAESARFEASTGRYPVVLRVPRDELAGFTRRLPQVARASLRPLDGDAPADPRAGVRVALEFEWLDQACAQILAHADGVEVLEPVELRNALVARCRAILEQHAEKAQRRRERAGWVARGHDPR